MIKITVNKSKCAIDIQAEPKEAVAEAIMATIHLDPEEQKEILDIIHEKAR